MSDEVVEYAIDREEAERTARAIEINCGGKVEIRPAADGYGWEIAR